MAEEKICTGIRDCDINCPNGETCPSVMCFRCNEKYRSCHCFFPMPRHGNYIPCTTCRNVWTITGTCVDCMKKKNKILQK